MEIKQPDNQFMLTNVNNIIKYLIDKCKSTNYNQYIL